MTQPLVTVVIPAYNAEQFIARAIESALGQSYARKEVVVVNDGSTDGTHRVLRDYDGLIIERHQPNAGPAAARNRGAKAASGSLIAFLDADDLWHPQKLAHQVAAFARFPSIAFSSCRRSWQPAASAWQALQDPEDTTITLVKDFRVVFADPEFGTPSIMIDRDVFWACDGFDETLSTSEDVDLWLRAAYGHEIAVVEAELWRRFRMPHGITHTIGARMFEDRLAVIDKFCREHPRFARERRADVARARAKVYKHRGAEAYIRGEYRRALMLLWSSMRHRVAVDPGYLILKTLLRAIVRWSGLDKHA